MKLTVAELAAEMSSVTPLSIVRPRLSAGPQTMVCPLLSSVKFQFVSFPENIKETLFVPLLKVTVLMLVVEL